MQQEKHQGERYGVKAFTVGDRVIDDDYGEGVVLDITPTEKQVWMPTDFYPGLLTVQFADRVRQIPSSCVTK